MNDQMNLSEPNQRVPLGGDFWKADPQAPLWGFADLHAHLMSHLAFGGKAFWGQPYDSDHAGPEEIQYALSSCEPIHGGLMNVNPEFGHPASGGWPEFIVWPRFTTIVHQQAYIDWIYRAYQGGLRLVTCLAVNNELLAVKSSPGMPHDDRSAIQVQVAAMKQMAAFVEAQSGGNGQGWMQIVYTPEEARQVISENHLAVILGVEVDSLGNWRRKEDLDQLTGENPQRAHQVLGEELDWLYALGIRQITPIHLTNNAFGGTAIYLRFLETVNLFVTGERWTVENAWDTGVRYRLDHDGVDVVDDFERTLALSGKRLRAMHRRTLIDHIPGIADLYEAVNTPTVWGGHANTRGLNMYGEILLEEMMARGMIIDVDHMSEKATESALALAERNNYPVICSHCWMRDLLFSAQTEYDPLNHERYGTSDVHKVAHEAGKRGDQVERIGKLGGMVAPILNQGDIAGLRRGLPELEHKIPRPNGGSSTSWGQAYLYAVAKMGGRGVAMGSDINGAAGLPGPRFGTNSAFGAHHDARRLQERRKEIDEQTNGVAYSTPIRDHRWHRFESSGPGAYDEEECDIWQAIAQYKAGFNPDKQAHPASDFPDPNVRETLERAKIQHLQTWVDNVTRGFWRADDPTPVEDAELKTWPVEIQAGYLAKLEKRNDRPGLKEKVYDLGGKVRVIWNKWNDMKGDNPPLERSLAGDHRDFDINLDGMAHYGMLPDLLQDLRNSGLTPEDFVPLFRSAFDYVQMWNTCQQRAQQIKSQGEKSVK